MELSMTGEDLKEILLAGADGCETVRDVATVEVLDTVTKLLTMFQNGELHRESSNGEGSFLLTAGPTFDLNKILSIIATIRDWQEKDNFTVQAAAMRGFSENFRILRFVAKRINRKSR